VPADLTDDDLLVRLLALNLERASPASDFESDAVHVSPEENGTRHNLRNACATLKTQAFLRR